MTSLPGLRALRDSMIREGISRQRFQYQHRQGARNITFDVVFVTDTVPHHLLFGARVNPLGLLFEVDRDLGVGAFLAPEEYRALCQLLDLKFDPNRRFSPATFLDQFGASGQIPSMAIAGAIPKVSDIPRPARHVSDEEKPYFSHWLDNTKADKHVSAKNLKRTALSFGQKIADYCAAKNISTCWTADKKKAGEIKPPREFGGVFSARTDL